MSNHDNNLIYDDYHDYYNGLELLQEPIPRRPAIHGHHVQKSTGSATARLLPLLPAKAAERRQPEENGSFVEQVG